MYTCDSHLFHYRQLSYPGSRILFWSTYGHIFIYLSIDLICPCSWFMHWKFCGICGSVYSNSYVWVPIFWSVHLCSPGWKGGETFICLLLLAPFSIISKVHFFLFWYYVLSIYLKDFHRDISLSECSFVWPAATYKLYFYLVLKIRFFEASVIGSGLVLGCIYRSVKQTSFSLIICRRRLIWLILLTVYLKGITPGSVGRIELVAKAEI